MSESGKSLATFIVTIKRASDTVPESYYVAGNGIEHAIDRALRMAKAKKEQIVEIKAA
jgi:hypothetical protein